MIRRRRKLWRQRKSRKLQIGNNYLLLSINWIKKVNAKKVNKDKLWKIEKITNHKCGKRKKKVSMLLIKWEGDAQLTWEKLSVINETASGMVKDYIESNKLKA